MKIDCDVIGDLLPLYAENMVSDKSRELIHEHIAECDACRQQLSRMEAPELEIVHTVDTKKSFKHGFIKHNMIIGTISAFITVSVIILVWGLFLLRPGDEMGYSLLCFYLFLPLTAFICSWILGTRPAPVKWVMPIIFGIIGGLLPLAIFHTIDVIFLFFSFIPSVIGLLIGVVSHALQTGHKKKRK